MKIALIAPPFISVPPQRYGGTELFIAQLAEGLTRRGIKVILYANGESSVGCELRYLYPHSDWPIQGENDSTAKDLNHTSWAIHDCWDEADIIHLNNVAGLVFARFNGPRFAHTIHHPYDAELSDYYSYFSNVEFVTISRFQQQQEALRRVRTIHHGLEMSAYKLKTQKQPYLCVLGRIAPVKGTHLAIEVAKRAGIPLKIAGEIQPVFRDYYESQVKPHIDGQFIEYIGEADLAAKNELLGNALAMLFPIQWNEPFGLVMIEAMATGTPVLAFPGGAVAEVVADGVSGYVCNSIEEMAEKARGIEAFRPYQVRRYVEREFSLECMAGKYIEMYSEALQEKSQSAIVPMVKTALGKDLIKQLPAEPEDPRAVA